MTAKHLPRRFSLLSIVGIFLIILSSVPPRAALAAVTVQKAVDNATADYSRGTFQRTSVGAVQMGNLSRLPDQEGAVQLSPIGLLKNWPPASTKTLPNGLTSMGAVALGNRLYVIGGDALLSNGQRTTTADVYSIQVSQQDGSLSDTGWEQEKPLVAAQASIATGFTTPTAPIASAGVVAVPRANGGGYIFVIGGRTSSTGFDAISSFAVRRAEVEPNGRITKDWVDLGPNARLLDTNGSDTLGLHAAAVTSLTIKGKTYIYVIGGLRRFSVSVGGQRNIKEVGSRDTFYAEVRDGKLYKPGTSNEGWSQITDTRISLPSNLPTDAGIWDASVVADVYGETQDVVGVNRAIYVLGGQLVPGTSPQYSSRAYIALVDDNGKPSWSNVIFDLGQPRVGQGSVTFRGNHYVSGGITNPVTNAPTDEVLTTFVNDDLSLNQFPDNTNFLKTEGVLRNPRAYHGMVVVPATSAGDKGTAFVYVIGGRGPDNRVFNDVIVARIGKDEDRNVGFAPDGWFYSKPYRITFLNAEVREIGWSSLITRTNDLNMDIEMEYRVSLDNDCDAATWTLDDWQQLDGTTSDANYRSVNGPNSVPVADEPARCFQYRARLVGGGPTSPQGFPTATPGLLNVSITIVIPGSPDLKVLSVPNDPTKNDIEATFNSNGSFTGLKVAVRNHNDKADTGAEPTLSANEDGSGGSFYVDLWIYKKDQAPGKPTVPFNGAPTGSTACAVVMKSEMTPDRVLPITSWYDSATCSGAPVLPQDVISRLGRGTYVVYVAVDSDCGPNAPHGCVDETSADNGEANNVTEYEFTVNPPEGKPLVSYDSLFPLMFKKP